MKNVHLIELKAYDDYIYTKFWGVKSEFIKLFLPNDFMPEKEGETYIARKLGAEEERKFCDKVILKL